MKIVTIYRHLPEYSNWLCITTEKDQYYYSNFTKKFLIFWINVKMSEKSAHLNQNNIWLIEKVILLFTWLTSSNKLNVGRALLKPKSVFVDIKKGKGKAKSSVIRWFSYNTILSIGRQLSSVEIFFNSYPIVNIIPMHYNFFGVYIYCLLQGIPAVNEFIILQVSKAFKIGLILYFQSWKILEFLKCPAKSRIW